MTELETGIDRPAPESAPTAPQRSRTGAGWLWLLLLILLAGAGYYGWHLLEARKVAERQVAEWRDTSDALQARIEALARELEASRERQRAIESRIGENANSARVVREEVLAISERAALLEDSVARLAELRERGELSLRLNEIEFLLQLGEERLRLFHDAEASLAAFRLADAALSGIDDASLSTLRQTLQIEINALEQAGPDPRPLWRRRIGELLQRLSQLPAAEDSAAATDPEDSRLQQLLSKLVTVRRVSDSQAALTPLERASRVASLRLQLGLALAALESGDGEAWRAALERALALFDGLFAQEQAATVAARATLSEAAQASLQPPQLDLGLTLRELRAMRASRALPRTAPAPAANELDIEAP